jgi:hypothetical protein
LVVIGDLSISGWTSAAGVAQLRDRHARDISQGQRSVVGNCPRLAWNPTHHGAFGEGLGGIRHAMSAESNDAEDAVARWRALEAEARGLAASMTDPEPRRIMLFIAEGYRLLRKRAEFRATQKIER